MSSMTCPVCGSPNLTQKIIIETIYENLGGQLQVEKKNYVCGDCKSEGDFFNENEEKIAAAITTLRDDLVVSILDAFQENKISMASMERALELPQRTLTKWKNKSSTPTAAGVTLLKYLKLYPWLLDVAENQFDYNVSQKIYLANAFNMFIQEMSFDQHEFRAAGVLTTTKSALFYVHLQKNSEISIGNTAPNTVIAEGV